MIKHCFFNKKLKLNKKSKIYKNIQVSEKNYDKLDLKDWLLFLNILFPRSLFILPPSLSLYLLLPLPLKFLNMWQLLAVN